MIRLLAISGSLREYSSNTNLLRALISLVPEGVEITPLFGLGRTAPISTRPRSRTFSAHRHRVSSANRIGGRGFDQ